MNLCFEIASFVYKKKQKTRPAQSTTNASNSHDEYWRWQFNSSRRQLGLYPGLDLTGKTVLDLGCGVGGRSAYIASSGAAKVVAIDINHEEIDIANRMADSLPADVRSRLSYHKTSENDAGNLGQFDVVLLIDSLEHVRSPVDILSLAYQYTRPGGVCYFGTIGWYHWQGSHMMFLGIPWINVFFSDKQILDATRLLMSQKYYVPTWADSTPPEARWQGINDLADRPEEHMNKITIKGMKQAMSASPFKQGELTVVGYESSKLKLLNWLGKVPGLDEYFHSYCVGRLQRPVS